MSRAAQQAKRRADDSHAFLEGLLALSRLVMRSCAWSLVYLELLLQAQVCTAVVTLAALLPGVHRRHAWQRARFCWGSMVNIRLLLKTMPVVGDWVHVVGDTLFEESLQSLSFMYRLLYYVL